MPPYMKPPPAPVKLPPLAGIEELGLEAIIDQRFADLLGNVGLAPGDLIKVLAEAVKWVGVKSKVAESVAPAYGAGLGEGTE